MVRWVVEVYYRDGVGWRKVVSEYKEAVRLAFNELEFNGRIIDEIRIARVEEVRGE